MMQLPPPSSSSFISDASYADGEVNLKIPLFFLGNNVELNPPLSMRGSVFLGQIKTKGAARCRNRRNERSLFVQFQCTPRSKFFKKWEIRNTLNKCTFCHFLGKQLDHFRFVGKKT